MPDRYPTFNDLHRRHEQMEREFDRDFRRVSRFAVAWGAFCAVLGVAALGLVAWAVVRLVLHFT